MLPYVLCFGSACLLPSPITLFLMFREEEDSLPSYNNQFLSKVQGFLYNLYQNLFPYQDKSVIYQCQGAHIRLLNFQKFFNIIGCAGTIVHNYPACFAVFDDFAISGFIIPLTSFIISAPSSSDFSAT